MLTYEDIQFRHGGILTSQMLKSMYAYPRDILELQYADYSDGIITGLNYEYRGGELWLTKGILKHKVKDEDRFYLLHKDISISKYCSDSNKKSGQWYCLYLKEIEIKQAEENIFIHGLELQDEQSDKPNAEGFFMGKFYYNKESASGITLPHLSDGFADPFKEFTAAERMNLLNVRYAGRREATFHPLVFAAVQAFLQQKEQKTMMDYALMVQLQNHPALSMETVRAYVHDAKQAAGSSREELFEAFARCLVHTKFEAAQSVQIKEDDPQNKEDSNSSLLLDDEW